MLEEQRALVEQAVCEDQMAHFNVNNKLSSGRKPLPIKYYVHTRKAKIKQLKSLSEDKTLTVADRKKFRAQKFALQRRLKVKIDKHKKIKAKLSKKEDGSESQQEVITTSNKDLIEQQHDLDFEQKLQDIQQNEEASNEIDDGLDIPEAELVDIENQLVFNQKLNHADDNNAQ